MVSPAVALKHLTSKLRVYKEWRNEADNWPSERRANLERERKRKMGEPGRR
jgi:hypothetical protein